MSSVSAYVIAASAGAPERLRAAYAACERLARGHYENFPVASRLLPARMRPHIAAVYGFARLADDFADEGERPAGERHHLLDDWGRRLHACLEGEAVADPAPGQELLPAVAHTVRVCDLPVSLFDDLLSAFRQDITTRHYDSWAALLDYCRRSANPIGRLVLRIAGCRSSALDRASDSLCTALQLTNFWQDLDRDWRRGRLYVPLSDVAATGARLEDLEARRWTPAWRAALALAAARTKALFDEGRLVCDGVGGRLRYELRLTWLGGRAILEALERQQFDVFGRRPELGMVEIARLIPRALLWSAR